MKTLDASKLSPRQRLEALARALSQPLEPGFQWDYSKTLEDLGPGCGTAGCALGLAEVLFGREGLADQWHPSILGPGLTVEFFGLNTKTFFQVFIGQSPRYPRSPTYEGQPEEHWDTCMTDVTPEMVAKEIEFVLANFHFDSR